jgi:hypothetical protein
MKVKNVHIFSGGTFSDITCHFAASAPAFGTTGWKLYSLAHDRFKNCNIIRDFTATAEFEKSRKSRAAKEVVETLIVRACLHTHPRKQPGAVVEKFKRNATPEQLAALKEVKGDTYNRPPFI